MSNRIYNTLLSNFRRQTRHWRRERGFTQAQLAQLTDLSVDMIGRLERGKVAPSLDTVARIAETLEIDPLLLFGAKGTLPATRRGQRLSDLGDALIQLENEQLEMAYHMIRSLAQARR